MVLAPLLAAALLGGSPSANLTITVWPRDREHASYTHTLRCHPASGTLPRPGLACRRLFSVSGNPFAPTPPGTACTLIYGGPQVAWVRGSFRGRRIWATFTRADGCAVARWNRVSFLFRVRL
jgi:hypothetical protein